MRAPLLFLAIPIAAAVTSCSSCAKKSSGEGEVAPVVLSPIEPPDGLLGEVTVASPDTFWSHLQHGAGGLVALLPMTLGSLVVTFASVDSSVATTIDGASPAYAAAIAHGADTGWAVAVKLTDLAHARATLIDGEAARYDGHDDGIWTLLSRKGGTAPGSSPAQIAISKTGALVISDSVEHLKAIGPYLVRTMPTLPRGTADIDIDVPHAALSGPLHDRLAAWWTQTRQEKEAQATEAKDKHRRAADFGDPSGILALADGAVQKRLALMPDLQSTHISISSDATSLTVDAMLTPTEGDGPAAKWISGLALDDAKPLLNAPSGVITMLTYATGSDPQATANDFESALKSVLGARLNAADTKLAHAAAADFSSGAGNAITASLVTGAMPGVFFVTPAKHPDVAARSIHEACELLDRPAFRAPLASLLDVSGSSFAGAETPGGASVSTFSLQRGSTDFVSASWVARDGNLVFAAGPDGAGLLNAPPSHTWRDDATVLTRATALGKNISFAVAAHPVLTSDPDASLLFAWGRDGSRGHASIASSDVVVRELIRVLAP